MFTALHRAPDPDLLRALLLDTLDAVHATGTKRVVCFTPAEAGGEMAALVPPDVGLLPQQPGDLGARMSGAFADLFRRAASAVLLVGSDLPLLSHEVILVARDHLHRQPNAVVLGPATDGGYYLIGATSMPSGMLVGMNWGADDVLARTLDRARVVGIDVQLLPAASDIDTPEDLRAVAAAVSGARRTRAWVRSHL